MFKPAIKILIPLILSVSTTAMAEINIYGPGGPAPAMKAVAAAFTEKTGITVSLVAGPAETWIDRAKDNADLIYSGSEAMMTDFQHVFQKELDHSSIEPLYLRPAVIVVRDKNPRHITGLKDLLRDDISIIVTHGAGQMGMWEDIAGRMGSTDTIRKIRNNIILFAKNTGEAKSAWQKDKNIDAWIVFNTWALGEQGTGSVVPLEPEYRIFRDTGIAFTTRGKVNKDTVKFVEFLKSEEGAAIFSKMGWSR